MDVKAVASKFSVKEKTVFGWCEKNFIRGVKMINGEYCIPDSVKEPYTRNRSKGTTIYTSIVKATISGYDVCAALYKISDDEFNVIINQLKKAGVIDSYRDKKTGIEYYVQTLSSSEFSKFNKNKIFNFFKKMKINININFTII